MAARATKRAGALRPAPPTLAEQVEALCSDLPEITVRTTGAARSFDIRRRSFCLFVTVDDPAGKAIPMLVLRADPEERRVLLAIGHPFFRVASGRDRLGVVLTPETDWEEIRELVTESYRVVAPRKLVALLDETDPTSL